MPQNTMAAKQLQPTIFIQPRSYLVVGVDIATKPEEHTLLLVIHYLKRTTPKVLAEILCCLESILERTALASFGALIGS